MILKYDDKCDYIYLYQLFYIYIICLSTYFLKD